MIASIVDRIVSSQAWLEGFGSFVQKVVGGIYKPFGQPGQQFKSFLHGAWLGHALHPVITDVPLGAWTVAIVADLVAYTSRVSPGVGNFCVLIGLIAAYGAVVTGYNDHHETYGKELRVATAHGLVMTVTTLLYTASFLIRWLGGGSSHDLAVILAVLGYVLLVSGAYLGGDLVFALGTMVNRNAFIEGPEKEFVRVGRPSDFAEGQMKKVDAGGMAVLVVRYTGKLYAISNTCSHAGGPLDEGELHDACVTCPWHFSQFDLTTGRVRRGPATFEQPGFIVREEGETVEVKLARSLHG
ncbi:MAG: Rieske 2Fe-2S domain-containing protein [Candidatus Dormibacteria bacterium]